MSELPRATTAEVRALSHPLRLRILALCTTEVLSNQELAERLHEKPATVLHHVRTLVRTGFLAADPPRPGPRGSTVRPYRATDKSWTIDVGGPDRTGGPKMAALDAAVAEMRGHPAPELGPLVLFSLRASRDQLEKLVTSLTEQLESVDEATEHTEDPVWNVLVATFPAAH
jgi:predicted ArsR family transcriptional regulator